MEQLPAARLSPLADQVDDILAQYGYEIRRGIGAIDDAVTGHGGLFEPETTDDEIRAAVREVLADNTPSVTDYTLNGDSRDIVLYVDGSSRGNPGPSGAGAVIQIGDEGIVNLGRPVGSNAENNLAEYAALQMGLEVVLTRCDPRVVEVRIDSMTVVNDIWGDSDGIPSADMFRNAIVNHISSLSECEWTHLADSDPNPADARAAVGADIAALGP
ncbi:ribonuclease HI family protein [Halorubrum sp. BOL3-1]|uniref:ribonuclease HI family protein n=1 Tax=Halorubrum sp. BOL3-1 TaxID=2497325 RepID=UPI0010050986|nr:ribonuclease HI family protein [Halorubrum sp. BOL3-1]QAU14093.1 ribonuclease HI family protein [Halorubrum sp. BOL3-1]